MLAEDSLYDHADNYIIERGRNYFLAGKVRSLTLSDDSLFEATVQGTALYNVKVGFDTDEFTLLQWNCDCPYDGNLCKHVAAVVFQIVEDPEGFEDKTETKIGPVSYKESVEEVLKSIPIDNLKSFVLSVAAEDGQFAKKFILMFPEYLSTLPKNYFNDKILSIVNSYSSGPTFLDPKSTSSALKEIKKLYESVQKQSRKKGVQHLVIFSAAIISTLSELAYRFRDNNNESKALIISAELALRNAVRAAEKDDSLRQEMLQILIDIISENTHPERQSYSIIINLVTRLIKSDSEAKRLMSAVNNKLIPMKYKEEQFRILLSLIEKFNADPDVLRFLAEHWEYPALREERINSALTAKNYKLAALLAEEGIKATPKNNVQIIGTWYGLLLKTAIRLKDDDKILNLTAETISHAGLVYRTDFYAMVKKYIGSAKWIQFVELLINILQANPKNFNLIAEIYIREQWGQRLLGHLMLKPELDIIQSFDDYLSKEFREELAFLYAGAITAQLKEAKSRGQYRDIFIYFKKVKKFGGMQATIDLKEELYQKFHNRPILLEELNRLRL